MKTSIGGIFWSRDKYKFYPQRSPSLLAAAVPGCDTHSREALFDFRSHGELHDRCNQMLRVMMLVSIAEIARLSLAQSSSHSRYQIFPSTTYRGTIALRLLHRLAMKTITRPYARTNIGAKTIAQDQSTGSGDRCPIARICDTFSSRTSTVLLERSQR